jgi:hypothetical protein
MPAISSHAYPEAVKRWMQHELKVLGTYTLWRSLGVTIRLAVIGLYLLGVVKYLSETPPESFFVPVVPPVSPSQTMILPPIMNMPFLQHRSATFFRGLPYIGPLYAHLPLFNHRDPWSYVVWAPLFPLGWLSAHLLRRKVKDAPSPTSINTYHGDHYEGDIGVVNRGTVNRIGTIAGRQTNIALPSPKEAADALVQVAEAVQAAPTIDQAQRRAVLERLLWLAQQTEVPAADRAHTTIRTIVKDLDGALSVAGKLARVWTQWGTIIKTFFGISDS